MTVQLQLSTSPPSLKVVSIIRVLKQSFSNYLVAQSNLRLGVTWGAVPHADSARLGRDPRTCMRDGFPVPLSLGLGPFTSR